MSDASGSFQYFNRTWLAFRGRTEAEERNNGWLDGLHPEDRTRCEHLLHSKIATLQPCQIEFRLRRHDAAFRWILCHGAPYYTGKDRFSGYIGSGIDITDLKEAETAKGYGSELSNLLVDSIPGPAYAKDSSGRFIAVNEQASVLLGRSRDAFQGKTVEQLGLEANFAGFLSRENEVLRSGSPMIGAKDAPSLDQRLTITPWGKSHIDASGIVVSERPRSSGGLSSFNRHETNNLVAIIRMYAEFLGEQPELDEKLKAKAHQISEAAERLNALVASFADSHALNHTNNSV